MILFVLVWFMIIKYSFIYILILVIVIEEIMWLKNVLLGLMGLNNVKKNIYFDKF